MHSIFLIAIGVLTITAASITCRNVEADADTAAAVDVVDNVAAATTSSIVTTAPTVAKIPAPRVRSRQSKEMKFDKDKTDNIRHDEPTTIAAVTSSPQASTLSDVESNIDDGEDIDDVGSSPWTMLLEDWVVSNPIKSPADRSSRQMHNNRPMMMSARFGGITPPPSTFVARPTKDFYITRRMSEAAATPNRNDRQHQQPPSATNNNNGFRPNFRPLPSATSSFINFEQLRQNTGDISETDLYLLSAIEKLVHRVDYLEKRLQTTDKLILHVLNDVRKDCPNPCTPSEPLLKPHKPTATTVAPVVLTNATTTTTAPITNSTATTIASTATKPTKQTMSMSAAVDEALCPRDFTSIARVCYHFDRNEHTDWKSANARCRLLGGHLAEFATSREYKVVVDFLNKGTRFAGSSFWLGGLNPGLLWIWSSSAKPVNPASNLAAYGAQLGEHNRKNSTTTTTIPHKQKVTAEPATTEEPQKSKNVFDIQGEGRCLNLQYNRTLRNFEYYGEDCSRPLGFVCEMRNRVVENEISRMFRALRLE